VPFVNGKPSGEPRPVLTGFVSSDGQARIGGAALRSIARERYWSPTTSAIRRCV
jgi:hypothetical protein